MEHGIEITLLGLGDGQHADLGRFGRPHLSSDGVGEELVSKAHPQIGPPHVHDECADSRLLSAHPRVLIFLPHILGAAHYKHEIVWLEIRNLLPFVELDGVPAQSILAKEVPKDAGMLANDMLKHEYFHSCTLPLRCELQLRCGHRWVTIQIEHARRNRNRSKRTWSPI